MAIPVGGEGRATTVETKRRKDRKVAGASMITIDSKERGEGSDLVEAGGKCHYLRTEFLVNSRASVDTSTSGREQRNYGARARSGYPLRRSQLDMVGACRGCRV